MNRGSRSDEHPTIVANLASMRPRFMNRGSVIAACDGRMVSTGLQ